MQAVGRLGSYISRGVYTVSAPFHPFGGAVDIIVVEQPDGSFKSSPWYVRFGKFQGVLKTREKVVNISVNGVEANFHMYLDHKGEAYFLREADGEEGESVLYPLPCAGETDGQSNNYRKSVKSKSYNYDSGQSNPADQVDVSNGKILSRANSRRARILGLVFGGRSMKEDGFGEAAGNAGMIRASSLERAEIAADLLEVKWSTNLASRRSRKDNASQFVVGDVLDGKGTKNMQINDGQGQVNSLACDHVDQIGPSSWCGMNPECSIGEASIEMSRLRSVEQIAENSVSDQSILENNSEVLSRDLSNAEVGAVNNHHDVNGRDISDMTCSDFQIQHEFDASPSMLSVEEQDCEEFGAGLSGSVVYEERGSPRVDSFLYCETSESSVVSFDGSCEQTHQKLYLATGGLGEVHVHAESLHATSEYIPKDTVSEPAMSVVLEVEELLTKPESFTHMVSIETTVGSVELADSVSIGMTSGGGNLAHQVQHENDIQDDFHPFDSAGDSQDFDGDPPSKSSEEEQFLFSDLDKSKFGELKHLGSISRDLLNENSNPSFCREGNKGVTVSLGGEPYLTPDKDVDDNSSDDRENIVENSRPTSSCISILRSHRLACGGEDGRVVESLPTSWSHIHDLDSHQRHPVSHSLDSDSKSVKWTLLSKDDTSSVKSAAGKQHQLACEQNGHLVAQEQLNFEDCQNTVEMELVLANQEVELSLCKHLLHEGMGAEAASQAFDAEKLDRDKFTFLGLGILKHDKLVVRVGGRYFPWDAAAPIISGKVSFGSGDVFEPKGMIAVDCYEKSPEVDSSKGSISPGGSWRLWPFPFNRSRSTEALPPVSNDARSDAESISGDTICSDGDENVHKPKVMKKMIKAMSPTSEQLASLNLMEGGNSVTFTFSTAMLGNQQVDARIYLWKWNTRIVISDVDGTITKSDVLGQFMPLVGIDWSQTGVAHLFSAIKENGYQLLFLSARAISQAYLTRQFLLNLKQDGKALPDGPVVISPDGLFPSLFREVIRRAPHEFKIACLEDIKALFPSDCNPFYAGFGNRDTDEISYLKVGIPRGKIFIINPKGEVAVNRRVDTKSYSSLQALVHGMFPAMTSFEQEDFNSWNFWKLPPPIIDI